MTITGSCEETSLDATLTALADHRSRAVVRYLRESADGVASCGELADHVQTHTTDEATAREATIRLHHVVLPKLDDADLVEYDPGSRIARYRSRPGVDSLIDHIDRIEAA